MEKALKSLKCKSLLDIILNPPKSYLNLFELNPNSPLPAQGVIKASIRSIYAGHKTLKIKAFALDFNEEVDFIFFHPKPFHRVLFRIDEVVHVCGTLQKKLSLEMIQPTKIKNFGFIRPIFSKQFFKSPQMVTLAQSLITAENLAQASIPEEMIKHLLPIFHPNADFFERFQKHNGFPPQSLRALKFVEIFSYLQKMQVKKTSFPAKFQCKGDVEPFISALPFSLTKGQREAIEIIRNDLSQSIATRRIVIGDVGCGKTIVILSAVIMAYPHKSILMAPTTILAKQLHQEAMRFLPSSIRIELVTSEEKSQGYKHVDFVIGTQALLYNKQETLEDFALVMSDEQHRFGASQRHTLEKLANSQGYKPHILQFSATPIPRTMALLQSNLIAHTFITDTPFKKDIDTLILHRKDFPTLLAHIRSEITQDRQIAIVYPFIQESQNLAYLSLKEGEQYWFRNFQNVYSTHGSDKNKDAVIAEFKDKGSILLTTTMIEVGISLPRLSTIVIVGAEKLGLSTLHQLRGRVSRNGLKGYCFLFTHQDDPQRLHDFAKTQNGFEIAEMDFKYRKGGDVLEGKHQSGDEFRLFDFIADEELLKEAQNLQNQL